MQDAKINNFVELWCLMASGGLDMACEKICTSSEMF